MTTRRFAYVAVTSLLVGAQLGVALVNVAMALLVVAWASSWRTQRAPRALWLPVAVLAGLTVAHTVVGTEAQSPETYAGSLRVLLVLLLVGSLSAPWSAAARQRALVVALAVAAVSMGYALVQVLAQTPGPLRALHPDALQWSSRNYRGSGDWLTFSINGLRGTGLVHHVLSFAHVSCVLALTGWAHALLLGAAERSGAASRWQPPSAWFCRGPRRLSRLCVRCRRPRALPMGVVLSGAVLDW